LSLHYALPIYFWAVRDGVQPRLRLCRNAVFWPRGAFWSGRLWLWGADREIRFSLVRGTAARGAYRNHCWRRNRMVRHSVAWHLFRDGDTRAVAGRLLRGLPIHMADGRRRWPAWRQRTFDLIIRYRGV